MNFNVICGLPRSGSTLLCNVLNQNPKFNASSTSGVLAVLKSMQQNYAGLPEFRSLSANDKENTNERIFNSMVGVMQAWGTDWSEYDHLYFDKCRQWPFNIDMLRKLAPESKIICVLRDLRSVFTSIEKHHRDTPMFNVSNVDQENTVDYRATQLFSKEGLIGSCLSGIDNLHNTSATNVMYLKYEEFTRNPQVVIGRLYEFLEVKRFEHAFEDVQDTSKDDDLLYNYKFPHHDAIGKIEYREPEWSNYMSEQISNQIVQQFSNFYSRFNYPTI